VMISSVEKRTTANCETLRLTDTSIVDAVTSFVRLTCSGEKVPGTVNATRLSVVLLSALILVPTLAPHAAASESKPLVVLLGDSTDARIVFSLTTAVSEERQASSNTYGRVVRRNVDVDRYNARAREIADEFGIAVNDLNGFMKKAGVAKLLGEDGIHLSPGGCEALGSRVAGEIGKALRARNGKDPTGEMSNDTDKQRCTPHSINSSY